MNIFRKLPTHIICFFPKMPQIITKDIISQGGAGYDGYMTQITNYA